MDYLESTNDVMSNYKKRSYELEIFSREYYETYFW